MGGCFMELWDRAVVGPWKSTLSVMCQACQEKWLMSASSLWSGDQQSSRGGVTQCLRNLPFTTACAVCPAGFQSYSGPVISLYLLPQVSLLEQEYCSVPVLPLYLCILNFILKGLTVEFALSLRGDWTWTCKQYGNELRLWHQRRWNECILPCENDMT